MKALNAAKRGGSVDDIALADCPEPSATCTPDIAIRSLLLSEVDKALQAAGASERDRAIFWLYYRDGLTAAAIASLKSLGLSTKGVESLILRLTRSVKADLAENRQGRGLRERQGNEGICTV
jgi:RNA polymerase sigma-70 factor, ECF subfamily